MTAQEHVAQLKAEEDRTFRWLRDTGHRRCGNYGCEEIGEHPGIIDGDDVLLCDFCRPNCGQCKNPALMGGEGGCEQHELEIWAEFHQLVDAVGGAA